MPKQNKTVKDNNESPKKLPETKEARTAQKKNQRYHYSFGNFSIYHYYRWRRLVLDLSGATESPHYQGQRPDNFDHVCAESQSHETPPPRPIP